MDLIASFSAHKVRTSHFLTLDGITEDGVLHFLFDTGAAVSLIGINSLFQDDENDKKELFKKIVESEIELQHVIPRSQDLKTVTKQSVKTYPCVSHGISIEGTRAMDFYFDLSLEDISIPLLGSAFTDDCAYNHAMNGQLIISAMKDNPGSEYYDACNVLDFDSVMTRFVSEADQ